MRVEWLSLGHSAKGHFVFDMYKNRHVETGRRAV